MRLRLTEEQSLIQASVDSLLEGEYDFAQRQRSLDAPHGCRAELWAQFAHMGWLSLPLPLEAGGLGGGALETGLLMRAFGRHLVVEPYLACALVACGVVASMARPDQAGAWLPGLMEGRLRVALAHEEPGQRGPWAAAKTSAVRRGGQWELRGGKRLARGAPGADALLVTATQAASAATPECERVFLLRPGAAGLSIQPARCADGAHAADLRLEGVLADDGDVLDAGPTAALHEALARCVVALCWEAVGAMTAAFEMTVGHARQRVQFGRLLCRRPRPAGQSSRLSVYVPWCGYAAKSGYRHSCNKRRRVQGIRLRDAAWPRAASIDFQSGSRSGVPAGFVGLLYFPHLLYCMHLLRIPP